MIVNNHPNSETEGKGEDDFTHYFNAVTRMRERAERAEDRVLSLTKALEWIAERESWPNWRLANYALQSLKAPDNTERPEG